MPVRTPHQMVLNEQVYHSVKYHLNYGSLDCLNEVPQKIALDSNIAKKCHAEVSTITRVHVSLEVRGTVTQRCGTISFFNWI